MITKHKNKNGKLTYRIVISLTLNSGKRIQKRFSKDKNNSPFTSIRDAERFKILKIEELKAKYENRFEQLAFRDWHNEFLNQSYKTKSIGTCYQYDGDLRKWVDDEFLSSKLCDIDRFKIQSWILDPMREKGATLKTQKRILKSLSTIFNSAIEHGYLTNNPTSSIKIKVPTKSRLVLNAKEAEIFLQEAKDNRHPFYELWAFALLTGMRSGELYALRWKNIDEVNSLIHVENQWTKKDGYHCTKTNKTRVVPISKDLMSLLLTLKHKGPFRDNLKALRGPDLIVHDLVLPRLPEWRYGNQSKVTREFLARVGIKPVKFHDLRATVITNLLAQGVSLPKVMSIVGHSKTSTTDEYLRLAGVEISGSTEKLAYSLPSNIISSNVIRLVTNQK